MVPAAVLLLLHVPPPTALLSSSVVPWQGAIVSPVMIPGVLFTVIIFVAVQPAPVVYVTMVVRGKPPVSIPLVLPIVATLVVPLVHRPPLVASVSVMFSPTHTVDAPLI